MKIKGFTFIASLFVFLLLVVVVYFLADVGYVNGIAKKNLQYQIQADYLAESYLNEIISDNEVKKLIIDESKNLRTETRRLNKDFTTPLMAKYNAKLTYDVKKGEFTITAEVYYKNIKSEMSLKGKLDRGLFDEKNLDKKLEEIDYQNYYNKIENFKSFYYQSLIIDKPCELRSEGINLILENKDGKILLDPIRAYIIDVRAPLVLQEGLILNAVVINRSAIRSYGAKILGIYLDDGQIEPGSHIDLEGFLISRIRQEEINFKYNKRFIPTNLIDDDTNYKIRILSIKK